MCSVIKRTSFLGPNGGTNAHCAGYPALVPDNRLAAPGVTGIPAPSRVSCYRETISLGVMCVGVLISAPDIATAQTREAESQVTVQGTVEAVDYTRGRVTIRGQQGNAVTLDVPANAPRFKQVKVVSP